MKDPDFTELVGDDGSPEELEQLRRTHELLIVAGPPPELSPRLAEAPKTQAQRGRPVWGAGRRRGAAFLLAGAVAAAAFGIGFLVGDHGSGTFPEQASVAMRPPAGSHSAARASVLIGERDQVGNWPLLVHVRGLQPLPKGQWYELYLTSKGNPTAAWCGSFSVKSTGRTSVQLSVPYKLKNFDGWVITTSKHQPKPQILLTT